MKYAINRGEMLVEYFPTEEMWEDVLTNHLQGKSYQIMRSNLVDMPDLYVEPGENAPAKGSNITGVKTKTVKSARHVKKPKS